ncbi:lipopolysaccharide biosynthesis protein [Pedobacter nyackensis]|uniref:Membrane protein involved in the export of O-antigen and teichoic acid n=1 Tax=Pedobacter nyackensis TaxID=475255 RepID=A0A1W2C5Z3_9SPHI|nr:hypothetical protein [Pedobacter nyackensis]SMC80292.1 Membrane protein involved in the export of O-antigen and teichoic acid [Pedobacter nyackensis]
MIRKRVFQYGAALVFTRGISFLFTLLIIRSLPIGDIGTYYFLIGISAVLEVFITWGSPVSIQTQSGKSEHSNMAFSAALLGAGLCFFSLILFFFFQALHLIHDSLSPIAVIFVVSSTLVNSFTSIALAYYRSMLNVKNDIYILLAKELAKFVILLVIKSVFDLSLQSILVLLICINVLTILSILIDLQIRKNKKELTIKKDISFLMKQGRLLMPTFFVYSFPFILIRIFGYTHFGKEATGLLNICLLTNAGFQLYASSWGMAVKPIIGHFNNLEDRSAIFKVWKETNWVYLSGCIVLYIVCFVCYKQVLGLFKLDADVASVRHLYFIILLYNLVYSIGAINNSFLQMLKLTGYELKGMRLGLLFYPLIIWYCFDKDIQTLAWAVVLLELFKLSVQEFVLYRRCELKPRYQLSISAVVILITGTITLICVF